MLRVVVTTPLQSEASPGVVNDVHTVVSKSSCPCLKKATVAGSL